MDADTNELVTRLSTAAGIIMEGSSPLAITRLSRTRHKVEARLVELERAALDAAALIKAAQVLARRNIR